MKFKLQPMETTICCESFVERNRELNVVSVEDMRGFFSSVRGRLSNMFEKEPVTHDLLQGTGNKNKIIKISNNITLYDLEGTTIVTPENFKGNIVDFTDDLITAYVFIDDQLRNCIRAVKTDIATGINNSSSSDFTKPQSLLTLREFKKKRDVYQNKLIGYFKGTGNYSTFKDVMRSPKDVAKLYERMGIFNGYFKTTSAVSIKKEVQELMVDIDTYVELLQGLSKQKTNALVASKEISEVLLELAKSVEFFGYVQANVLAVAGTVTSIAKVIGSR